MNILLLLLVVAFPLSAQVLRGPASWPASVPSGAAASVSAFLNSPAASGLAYGGLADSLRAQLLVPGAPALAPVLDALAAQGLPEREVPTAAQFERALVDASRAVQAGGGAVLAAANPADEAGWSARSERLSTYIARYGAYLPAHDIAALRQGADVARVEAARLRGVSAAASSRRIADELGRGPAPETVSGADARPAGLDRPSRAAASAPRAEPAVPSPAAPRKSDALTTAAIYVGGGIVITAMALFFGTAWATLGTGAAVLTSATYLGAFLFGARLLEKKGYPVASGMFATLAVVMAPVTTAAAMILGGSDFETFAPRLLLEGSAAVAGILAARRFRFGFLAMPVALSLFVMAAEIAHQVLPNNYAGGSAVLFAALGGLMTLGGRVVELKIKGADFARWIYLAGLSALVGGGALLSWNFEILPRALFAFGGLGLVATGALLDRKSFAVFGAIPFFSWIGWLLWSVLGGTLFSYFAMAGFGVGVIATAVLYQKNAAAITAWLRARLARS